MDEKKLPQEPPYPLGSLRDGMAQLLYAAPEILLKKDKKTAKKPQEPPIQAIYAAPVVKEKK